VRGWTCGVGFACHVEKRRPGEPGGPAQDPLGIALAPHSRADALAHHPERILAFQRCPATAQHPHSTLRSAPPRKREQARLADPGGPSRSSTEPRPPRADTSADSSAAPSASRSTSPGWVEPKPSLSPIAGGVVPSLAAHRDGADIVMPMGYEGSVSTLKVSRKRVYRSAQIAAI